MEGWHASRSDRRARWTSSRSRWRRPHAEPRIVASALPAEIAMILNPKIVASIVLGCLVFCGSPTTVRAEDAWPTRPVRIMVGFAAGGATDIIARLVARKMEQT